jgi:hypothetical protein
MKMKSSLAEVYIKGLNVIEMLTQHIPRPSLSQLEFSSQKPPSSITGTIVTISKFTPTEATLPQES